MPRWTLLKTSLCLVLVAAMFSYCRAQNEEPDNGFNLEFIENDFVHGTRTHESGRSYDHTHENYINSHHSVSKNKDGHARVKRDFFFSVDMSPFDQVKLMFDDFISQVAAADLIYCNSACVMTTLHTSRSRNGFCAKCYCDDVCETYGDCCSDLVLLHNYTQTIDNFIRCEPDSLKIASDFYMMISACPEADNQTKSDQCSQRSDEKWISNIPVTSHLSGKTYRNVYCASCHGVDEVISWKTKVYCGLESLAFENTSSVKEVYTNAVHDTNCDVRFIPKKKGMIRRCSNVDDIIIKECNVSGLWKIYDENVEKACHTYRNIVHKKYWNVFCYCCNTNIPWFIISSERPELSDVTRRAGLMALLHVEENSWDTEQSSQNKSQCSIGQIFDPYKKTCRHVACPPGKKLHNDQCSSIVEMNNIFGYRLCLLVHIVPLQPLVPENVSQMASEISESLLTHIPENALSPNITLEILDLRNCEGSDLHILWKLNMFFFAHDMVVRDEFEDALAAIIQYATDDIQELYNKSYIAVIPYWEHEFKNPILKCMESLRGHVFFAFHNFISYLYQGVIDKLTILEINALLRCPHVILTENEVLLPSYKLSIPDPTFNLTIKASKRTVKSSDYDVLSNRSIRICAQSYMDSVFRRNSGDSAISTINFITIVCTCLSLIFLVLSFAVYCFLPKLRTSGGVLNMGLIVTLFLAQTLFQFGLENTSFYTLCVAIGISVHFFWLASVWWMNAIIIYLFYTLCFPLKSMTLVPETRKVFLTSCLYSYGCSAVIVLGTIVANVVIFGDIGYVQDICYLKRDNARKFAFCIPIGIVVLTNVMLFIVTMWNLHKRKSVCSSKEHKISMIACVKLSVTTGLSWGFAYLYLFTKVMAFSVTFSILVSSQGMFLFFAFLANKRVWVMFQQMCKQKKTPSRSASSSAFTSATTINSHV